MFKITDEKYLSKLSLVSEISSEYTFICPVCEGKKFKVRKINGAYACYSNFCSTADIRSKLGVKEEFLTENKLFSKPITHLNFQVSKQIKWLKAVKYIEVLNYKVCTVQEFTNQKHTSYVYNEKAKVERIDFSDGRKKQFYPKHMSNSVWNYGVGNTEFGLFNDKYITNQKGTFLFAEGEKTADILIKKSGYLTLSPPPFGWKNNYLTKEFLKHLHLLEGIIYFPDNDEPGIKKAELIQQAAWGINIPCYIVPLSEWHFLNEGDDIADLILDKDINIHNLLKEIKDHV